MEDASKGCGEWGGQGERRGLLQWGLRKGRLGQTLVESAELESPSSAPKVEDRGLKFRLLVLGCARGGTQGLAHVG